MPFIPPHLVIDDFLPAELHDALLDRALRQEASFDRAAVQRAGAAAYGDSRKAWTHDAGLGELKGPLQDAIRAALPTLFDGLGMAPFKPARIELEMSAHRDGDYFRPHVDTFVSRNREGLDTDRVVTAVYYFHAQPRGFSGGEFVIHPIGGGDPVLIEPKDNRLLAIPAFALHEVRTISCPGDDFRSARFAVNVWVHRARAAAP